MSEAIRQELADAANSVSDINAHPYYLQGTAPGHTYIRSNGMTRPNKFGDVGRWNVVVVLPQDQGDAERFQDAHVPDLLAALGPHFTIQEVVPQQLNISGVGNLPCVFINGSREE